MLNMIKILFGGSGLSLSFLFAYKQYDKNAKKLEEAKQSIFSSNRRVLPTRDAQLQALQNGDVYDVLIIGGGATGSGCALDATTRGLKTALVEMDDFASGTSSRSTKLIHGGVRYLQKAILNVDYEQYKMVKEALNERAEMLASAPFLAQPLPIMLPIYNWWQVPYYWLGIKAYDFVAGSKLIKSSYFLSKRSALEIFPMLRSDRLCGALVYYDGQQDDARMNLVIALTAARYGATVANHVKTIGLVKDSSSGLVSGAYLRDELTGNEWKISAKCVINATGPMTDSIRLMDESREKKICAPSSGVHIVLPGYYSPEQMGLLDPATSDGRVIFFLPWQRHTIAGTTDMSCDVSHNPKPTEEEILFILNEVKNYLNKDVEVRRADVLSAWSGIRPLVSDPNKQDTQSLARNHIVHVSKSNLVTIAGGKWTTYRAMASDTIDRAIEVCNLRPKYRECQTQGLLMEGAYGWTPTMFIRLVQDFGLEIEVAKHMATTYGDRAFPVARLAAKTGQRWPTLGKKIHPEFPYIEAEIRYGIKEYARTAIDMIARRLRLAFLNVQAAEEALPRIIAIMAEELNWSEAERVKQMNEAMIFLREEMSQQKVSHFSREDISSRLSRDDLEIYKKRFKALDKDNKGYISLNDIRRSLKEKGEKVTETELHEIISSIDTNRNGQVELDEYLEMMAAISSGHVTHSKFARVAELESETHPLKTKITVERSGGGV